MLKNKAAEFFDPLQRGVACEAGAEKIAHGLRGCMDENWQVEGFTVLKIDLVNAFNLVCRQALLSECSTHFPELLPWVSWCYSRHPVLWHTLGNLTSQSGVQQGDPLGPLLFSLVLNSGVSRISARGVLKVRPHTKSGGGASGPIYEKWGGGALQVRYTKKVRKRGGALQVRYTKSGGGGGGGGGRGGGGRFRSDIRKVEGGGASGPIYEKWGGQSTSGPIYEKWGGGGGGPVRFRSVPLFGTQKIRYR